MMTRWSQWWGERSQREQVMLSVMIAAILMFLAWFLIVRPVIDGLKLERARFDRAVVDLATVTAKADALKALKAKPTPRLNVPIAAFVTQSASEVGFTLTRTDPVGTDSVAIAILSAKTPALLGWLGDLESRGLFVSELSIRPNNDMTVAIEAVLKARTE